VQIGAELLCKSAKVNLGVGVGTGVGVGKYFQVSRGRDVITIASVLVPNGCDVIASLPKTSTPPILHTQYSILFRHICTFAQAEGRLHFCTQRLPFEALQHAGDHAVAIFFAQAGAGGEAEALLEETFADLTAVHLGSSEDGLEMHGLPDRSGFDVLGFEREADLLTGDAGDGGVDGQAG